jgi:AraC-like DNA-binding protein
MKSHLTSYRRGALTRCITHDEKKVVISEKASHTDVLVTGHLVNYSLKEGIEIYGGSTCEMMDFQVISMVKKSILITILLQGKLEFGYGELMLKLNAFEKAIGIVVNLTKPSGFRKKISKGNHVTKLNLVLNVDWLKQRIDSDINLNQFLQHHQANIEFVVTQEIVGLVEKIISEGSPIGLIERLKFESVIDRLLIEIFQQLESYRSVSFVEKYDTDPKLGSLLKGKYTEDMIDKLVNYIETHLDQGLSTKMLAQRLAMSESSLQRKFKSALGLSIQSYIKRRKLDIAKLHLQEGIISITEIAYNAGYRHPSNFTSAFKKAFGYPPIALINESN